MKAIVIVETVALLLRTLAQQMEMKGCLAWAPPSMTALLLQLLVARQLKPAVLLWGAALQAKWSVSLVHVLPVPAVAQLLQLLEPWMSGTLRLMTKTAAERGLWRYLGSVNPTPHGLTGLVHVVLPTMLG
jgi:hypothetical protein